MKLKILEILDEKKISVYKLHVQTKISERTLYALVNNEVQGTNFKNLEKIAKTLDVSIDELFDREDHSDEGSC